MSKHQKTICIDFDGVIHSYTSGWQGASTIPDPIVEGAIAFMLGLLAADYEVAIFSTRSLSAGGLPAMRSWLKKEAGNTWFPTPDGPGLESVKFPMEKPPAIMYLDDRAVYFTGTFPSIDFVREFRTWQGK